jgi:hypothetical protein
MAITKRIGSRRKEQLHQEAQKLRQADLPSRKYRPGTFRIGMKAVCEAQLWKFTGPKSVVDPDEKPTVERVAATSLDQALKYMAQRHDDFIITKARCVCIIPMLAGSPLD